MFEVFRSASSLFFRQTDQHVAEIVRIQIASGDAAESVCDLGIIGEDEFVGHNPTKIFSSVFGFLGLLYVEEPFLAVISKASKVGGITQNADVFQLQEALFISFKSSRFDSHLAEYDAAASSRHDPERLHPCSDIMRLLNQGTFYYSNAGDITLNCQKRAQDGLREKANREFCWNEFLLKPILSWSLLSNDASTLVRDGFKVCMQGYVGVASIYYDSRELHLAVISRISTSRAGDRLLSRGINDDGSTSNFVETETIIEASGDLFSYIVIRGSVPIFWDQQGFQFGGYQKIQLTRSATATQPAFDRHFADLFKKHGLVHAVDLLSQKEGQIESTLSNAYYHHIRNSGLSGQISHTSFDFYAFCTLSSFRRLSALSNFINKDIQVFGFFFSSSNEAKAKLQKGVFRVNCFDCLDRTNVVQHFITKTVVELFARSSLYHDSDFSDYSSLFQELSELWADNGDALSFIYTGSGAIKSKFTRTGKITLYGFVDDVKKSAHRMIVSSFPDKAKQQAIDTFLGNASGQKIIVARGATAIGNLLTGEEPVRNLYLYVVSWNTNGCTPPNSIDIAKLLSPPSGFPTPNIYVCAFQEIVQLNPSQVSHAQQL